MNRRTLILALALLSLPIPAASQDGRLPLSGLSDYFNSFRTAEADFTQINPDGTLATGRLTIRRPGRMRLEYDPPDANLVIAAGGSIHVFDARSNDGPTTYPLNRTPLALILADRIDLERARMVVDHFAEGPTTSVVAQDPDNPGMGHIRLVFSAEPTELRQWIVTDDMGTETTVILGDMVLGTEIADALFSVDFAIADRVRR